MGRTSNPKREDLGGWRVDVGDDRVKLVQLNFRRVSSAAANDDPKAQADLPHPNQKLSSALSDLFHILELKSLPDPQRDDLQTPLVQPRRAQQISFLPSPSHPSSRLSSPSNAIFTISNALLLFHLPLPNPPNPSSLPLLPFLPTSNGPPPLSPRSPARLQPTVNSPP